MVEVSLTAAGDVSDFTETRRLSIASAFADEAGIAHSAVEVQVSASSVRIVVIIPVVDVDAQAALRSRLRARLPSAAAATDFLASASVSVEAAVAILAISSQTISAELPLASSASSETLDPLQALPGVEASLLTAGDDGVDAVAAGLGAVGIFLAGSLAGLVAAFLYRSGRCSWVDAEGDTKPTAGAGGVACGAGMGVGVFGCGRADDLGSTRGDETFEDDVEAPSGNDESGLPQPAVLPRPNFDTMALPGVRAAHERPDGQSPRCLASGTQGSRAAKPVRI